MHYHNNYKMLLYSTSFNIIIITYVLLFEDLIAIGDIESFFNENFFKKVQPVERKIDHRNNAEVRFNGSPETAYEPFYNTYIHYNATQPNFHYKPEKLKKPSFRKQHHFSNLDEEITAFKSPKVDPRPIFKDQKKLDPHNNEVTIYIM